MNYQLLAKTICEGSSNIILQNTTFTNCSWRPLTKQTISVDTFDDRISVVILDRWVTVTANVEKEV